jgi:6-phosphogluconolactonase (cycloisomerase 2 family)
MTDRRNLLGAVCAAAACAALLQPATGVSGGAGPLSAKACIDDNDFETDPDQGEDRCAKDVNGLAGARAVVISPDGGFVYVSSEDDDAIVAFKRNSSTGKLKPMGCVDDNDHGADPTQGEDNCQESTDGLAGAGAMVISENGRSLYAVGEADDSVVRFNRNRNSGVLTPAGCVDDNDAPNGPDFCAQSTNGLDGVSALAISSDGNSLYAASEGDDAIVRFGREDDGSITPQGCLDDNDFAGDPSQGEDVCAQSTDGLAGATGVALSPNGKSLYATSEFDGAIVSFARNESDGTITPQGCIDDNVNGPDSCATQTKGLVSNESLVISRKGDSLYLVAEGSHAVLRFDRNKNTGALNPKGCIEDKQEGTEGCGDRAHGLSEAGGIAISADAKSIYIASGGDDAVTALARKRSGAIKARGCVDDNDNGSGEGKCDSKGDGLGEPEGIAAAPGGKHLYVATEGDDAVVLIKR